MYASFLHSISCFYFSAYRMSDFDLYKENIQPGRRGHSAQELSNLSKLSDPRQGIFKLLYIVVDDFNTF